MHHPCRNDSVTCSRSERSLRLVRPKNSTKIQVNHHCLLFLANVSKVIQKRQRQKILEDDLAALEEWLSFPTQASDCLQFVRGFLLVSPSELAKDLLEESAKQAEPLPLLEMSLPEGAKLRRVESRTETGALLRWKGLITSLDVVSSEAAANLAELEGQKGAGDEGVEISVSPVSFGGVKGTKFVRTGDSWFGPLKDGAMSSSCPVGMFMLQHHPLVRTSTKRSGLNSAGSIFPHALHRR